MAKLHNNGYWFQDHRMRLGLTQAALAKKVGVDRSYIAQIEGGNRWPTEQTLYRILAALGVDPAEAIQQLSLVRDNEKERVLQLLELTKRIGKKLSDAERTQLQSLLNPGEANSYRLLADLAVGGGIPASPEGWQQLDKEDRRLVQRVINRILASYPGEADLSE